ncbi:SAM-dependent methyltransferase, partial [Pseudomonadota bacterium]
QHYEVPAEFFGLVMGGHRKYSSCYWNDDTLNLVQAEAEALRLTCGHAGIEDGMQVLDLGCGWGSLSLWIAAHYPACKVVSVSNSNSQPKKTSRKMGIANLIYLYHGISLTFGTINHMNNSCLKASKTIYIFV